MAVAAVEVTVPGLVRQFFAAIAGKRGNHIIFVSDQSYIVHTSLISVEALARSGIVRLSFCINCILVLLVDIAS